MYYELHITMAPGKESAKEAVESLNSRSSHWTYSRIDGDPSLGEGVKEYATNHQGTQENFVNVLDYLNFAANQLLVSGHQVVRRKIELVMYDTKGKEK